MGMWRLGGLVQGLGAVKSFDFHCRAGFFSCRAGVAPVSATAALKQQNTASMNELHAKWAIPYGAGEGWWVAFPR